MSTEINVTVKQDFINLKPQSSPPATQSEGILFLIADDNKPKYRAPNNGIVYSLTLAEYRAKELTYTSNGDTNGLLYYIGSQFGQQEWTPPRTRFVYTSYTSEQYDPRSIGSNQLFSRQEGFFSTFDYPDSQLGIQLITPESILLKGVFIRAANITDYGFPISWKVVILDQQQENYQTLFEVSNNDILNGINKEIYIPISNVNHSVKSVLILQTGLNSIGTNHLALGQIEVYGKFS